MRACVRVFASQICKHGFGKTELDVGQKSSLSGNLLAVYISTIVLHIS